MYFPAPDESIWVGMLRLVLAVPHSRSLKDKRHAVASVRDRLRAKGGLSVAEVGHLDSRSRAVLAAVIVGNDPQHLRSLLDGWAAEVERWHLAIVESRSVAVFRPPDPLTGSLSGDPPSRPGTDEL